jgi:hypothetical protein
MTIFAKKIKKPTDINKETNKSLKDTYIFKRICSKTTATFE